MKYIQKIDIINESKNVSLFNTHKEYIENITKNIVNNTFDFDISLKVYIKDFLSDKTFVNNEIMNANSICEKDIYSINISIENLELVSQDGGIELYIALYHELGHIYDIYKTQHNPECNIELLKTSQKTFDDFELYQGFSVWTEIFAYYFTFKEFKKYHNYPTVYQLVNLYKNLQEDYYVLSKIIHTGTKLVHEMADTFMENINVFLYACAKHISGVLQGVSKNMKYSKKTTQSVYYKETKDLLCELFKNIQPLFTNTHGKLMIRKLRKLGEFLITKVYGKFGIAPIEHKGYIRFAFFTDDN